MQHSVTLQGLQRDNIANDSVVGSRIRDSYPRIYLLISLVLFFMSKQCVKDVDMCPAALRYKGFKTFGEQEKRDLNQQTRLLVIVHHC